MKGNRYWGASLSSFKGYLILFQGLDVVENIEDEPGKVRL